MSQIQISFPVHVNSLMVYKDKILPQLAGRKLEVLNAIQSLGGTATLWEVGQFLNRPLNTISGRFSELKKLEMIVDTGINKEHNGNRFSIYKLTQPC